MFSYRAATYQTARRGRIGSWSAPSRSRLIRTLAAIDWPTGRDWWGVTLTYPERFPGPAQAKADVRAWRERLTRRWGPAQGVWKLEFQRRGAPHFHVLLRAPQGVPLPVFQRWLSRAWFEVVGSNDLRHFRAGTKAQRLGSSAWQYLVGEVAGHKGYQELVPEGVEVAGRWWGRWNLDVRIEEREIEAAEFFALRRVLRRLGAKRGYRRRFRWTYEGMWLLSRAPAGMLAESLDGWARELEAARGVRLTA